MSKISIIIPVYNLQNFIAQTIDSVLNQTFGDYELIIVDDGSCDDSLKILDINMLPLFIVLLLTREK